MYRILFVATLAVLVLPRLFTAPTDPWPVIAAVSTAGAFGPYDSTGVVNYPVKIVNRTRTQAFIRGCGRSPAMVVEREMAGRWYAHQRIGGACGERAYALLWRGDSTWATVPIVMPGRYRVRLYYDNRRGGSLERLHTAAFVRPRITTPIERARNPA